MQYMYFIDKYKTQLYSPRNRNARILTIYLLQFKDILDILPIGDLYFKFDFPTVCGQAPMTSFIEKIYMCIGAIN